MKSRVSVPLYDALYTYGPISEVEQVKEIHKISMVDINKWTFGKGKDARTLEFEIDTEVTIRWACKMDESDKALYKKYSEADKKLA